jgi:hypothetical protein
MTLFFRRGPAWFGVVFLLLFLNACAVVERPGPQSTERLRETAKLVEDVKAFGKTLGIEPTAALSRTAESGPVLSMLWLWMQRNGTLARLKSVDIRMAIGFDSEQDLLKVEQVYRVDGYSVYYRQGNEYADSRSAATPGFAAQGIVRRVNVILHEDLHGDANFDLPWDIEEAVVTPLGSLAAVEYFKYKGDIENMKRAQTAVNEGRQISRELNDLAQAAEKIFRDTPVEEAKQQILGLLPNYPAYQLMFQRQVRRQHPATVLEAKLSHDLAYFRYFDAIVALAAKPTALKTLIEALKKMPRDATPETADKFLQGLGANNLGMTNY